MTSTTFLRGAALLATATFLAACSGVGSAPPTATTNALIGSQQQSVLDSSFDAMCPKKNGIKVDPCTVKLSVSSPTANVTVSYPSGDDVKFSDKKCSNKSIATVEGSGADYVVTAGTATGKCTVLFTVTSGKKLVGNATLKITNNV